jgi:serine/threonine protein kinase
MGGPFNNFPGANYVCDGKEWAMLLEYCEGGNLTQCKNGYLRQQRAVPEMLIWKYFFQIAEALAFLHWGYGTEDFDPSNPYARDYSFVHRDLKPCNILRTATKTAPCSPPSPKDPYPDIKLCDFGMSSKLSGKQYNEARTGGSEFWQPPEQCQPPNLAGPAQDMWALGAIIHYLALGEPPCDGSKGNRTLNGSDWRSSIPRKVTEICKKPTERVSTFKNTVVSGLHTEFSDADVEKQWSGCYSKLLNHFMQRCLHFDASKRATSFEIVRELGAFYRSTVSKCKGNPAGFAKRVRNIIK